MFPTPSRMAAKYRNALGGLSAAWRLDDSFRVHLPVAILVTVVAWWLRVSLVEGLLLAMCVAAVIAAELFNTSIEQMAKAVTREENADVRDSLDLAAAGVLTVAMAAKIVGTVIFANRLFG